MPESEFILLRRFASNGDAEAFARHYGGKTVAFDDIPTDYIIGDTGEHGSTAKQAFKPRHNGFGSRSVRSKDATK